MFIKVTVTNGFCGCDEENYFEVENEEQAEIETESCYQSYSFLEPDDRFCDMDNEDEIEEYYNSICADWEEITEEEYNDNI